MPASRLLPAALLVVALGLSACGAAESEDTASDFQGEERRVAEVVEELQDAGAERDGNRICERLLAPTLRQEVQRASGGSCASALDDALDDVDATDLEVTKVEVAQSRATASVRGEGGGKERLDQLSLERTPQGWRISGLGG